jgi:hypothetical protein
MHGTPHVNFVFDAPQRQRQDMRADFAHALEGAQAAMMSSMLASSGYGSAMQGQNQMQQGAPQQGTGAGPLVWRQAQPLGSTATGMAATGMAASDMVANYAGMAANYGMGANAGMSHAGMAANSPMAPSWAMANGPLNWRGDQETCGCEGNISAMMPTNWAGVPLSTFDFMSPPFGMGNLGGMPGMGGTGMGNMGGAMSGQGQMGHGMHGAAGMPQGMPFGAPFGSPMGNPGIGMPPGLTLAPGMAMGMGMPPGLGHAYGAPQAALSPHGTHAPHGGNGGMNGSMPGHHGAPHPLSGLQQAVAACGHGHGQGDGHADHTFISLDGIDMVHAKDEIRAGEFLSDDTFFDRLAAGQFGEFSGVSLNMEEDGNLDGQVYISGHPAAFHKLYNEGREKGLNGEELNQFIAEELTNVNDIDDIPDQYYEYWESLGVPRPVKDHDLHNIGAVAVTLAPGQNMSLTGAHTYDTPKDKKYNFTDVKNDPRGTFIEFYRLSNNNNSGNGHHEDLAAAARIYLSQSEIGRIATGTKPIDIVNERITFDDNAADYRISPAAVRMLASMQMPVY